MRSTFTILTVILILIGFAFPLAWAGALVTGIVAMASAPQGTRPDGKRKTGGLFGSVIDDFAMANKMKECPYCKSKIMKDAWKCPNCGEWVKE